jgi:deoxyribodipyrimidine photolyase-related protein
MKSKKLLILLGNQLFPKEEIKKLEVNEIFMAEDYGLCTYERHHKLKILMFLSAMREKRDELINAGFQVEYLEIECPSFYETYESKIIKHLSNNKITELRMFEIEDKDFEERMIAFAKQQSLKLTIFPSPMFLINRDELSDFIDMKKNIRMGNFYKKVRKRLNLLVDQDQKPIGGKWSFDDENRKKIPKGQAIPMRFIPIGSKYIQSLKKSINEKFSQHPGKMNEVWMPLTRQNALEQIDHFLEFKFENFGIYEDAILKNDTFLFHSAISPTLNMGLITPTDIIKKVNEITSKIDIPLNSIEGFLRQIIGWREFIRGIYQQHSETQLKSNFFKFSRSLNKSWYMGETGIPPLDDAIRFSDQFGYTHHINRLMVISNLMTLCEIHPKYVYRWFMEMFVDASEWVMTPNVFGMGTFSDGGIFATKPYICGSNYILKMSDYKKDSWCNTVDGLYWRFVSNHKDKLKGNPRLSFMVNTLDKMKKERKELIFKCAEDFIAQNCTQA